MWILYPPFGGDFGRIPILSDRLSNLVCLRYSFIAPSLRLLPDFVSHSRIQELIVSTKVHGDGAAAKRVKVAAGIEERVLDTAFALPAENREEFADFISDLVEKESKREALKEKEKVVRDEHARGGNLVSLRATPGKKRRRNFPRYVSDFPVEVPPELSLPSSSSTAPSTSSVSSSSSGDGCLR